MSTNNMTLEDLNNLHNLIVSFEDNKISATKYFEQVTNISGMKLNGCNTCGAYNNKLHNDIQIMFWNKVSEIAPDYLPKTTMFKLAKFNSPYYQEQIPTWSFKLIKNNIEALKTERDRSQIVKRDQSLYDAYQSDIETLTKIYQSKRVFQTYEEDLSDDDLIRLKDAGWSTTQIADRLKVSNETVRKKLKKFEPVTSVEQVENVEPKKAKKASVKKKEVNNEPRQEQEEG